MVNVLPEPKAFPYGDVRAIERGRHSAAHESERLLVELVADRDLPAGCRTRHVVGRVAKSVLQITEDENAELLVLAPRGRGVLRSALRGSHSRAIAARAKCPVILASPGCDRVIAEAGERFRSVVCGVEDRQDDLPVALLAAGLAERLGSHLHLVQVPSPSRGPKHLVSLKQRTAVKGTAQVAAGPPAAAIRRASETHAARLIVVGAGRRSLRGLFRGSVAQQLTSLAAAPIAILPRDDASPRPQT